MTERNLLFFFLDLIFRKTNLYLFHLLFIRFANGTGDHLAIAPDGLYSARVVVFVIYNGPEFRHGADFGSELPARHERGLVQGSVAPSGRHAADETRRQLHGIYNFPFGSHLRKFVCCAVDLESSKEINYSEAGESLICLVCMN